MVVLVQLHSERDDPVLRQRRHAAHRSLQFLAAYLHDGTSTGCHTVAIGIGYLTLHLEVAQVGDDGYLATLRHLRAYLVVDVGQDGLARRAHLRIFQRTLGFGQPLAEDAELQLLHLVLGLQHLLFVGILLLQLLVLQLCHVVAQFGLTHLIRGARPQAVQILLVAQFHLHAVQLHGRHLHLHLQVAQFRLVVGPQLLQLVAAHLLFVQLLLVVGLRTLQVQLQDGCSHVHAVTPLAIHLQNAGVDGRIDDFFKGRHYLARGTDAHLYRTLGHFREGQILLLHASPHQRNDDAEQYDTCYAGHTVANQSLVALLAAHLFRNFSIHTMVLFIVFKFECVL